MMLNDARLKELLDKALAGNASDAELRELTDALQHDDDLSVTLQIDAVLGRSTGLPVAGLPVQQRIADMADQILAADKPSAAARQTDHQAPVRRIWRRVAVAAAVLGIIAVTVYYLLPGKHPAADPAISKTMDRQPSDFVAGSKRARIILADRSVVILDSAANGVLSVQGNIEVSKSADGKVAYATGKPLPGNEGPAVALYNTVEVPRGGHYQLVLSDGTQVWLNAASSLHFPVAFSGQDRVVELEGEGYFEVAKDAARPFTVRTRKADVNVLGTHFNVCAYAGEDWKTTLLEGSVAVKSGAVQTVLKPGNQALIPAPASAVQVVREADLAEAIAWKEGFFQFNEAPVATIMQQVSRWYDVDVVYKDSVVASFNGRINRDIPLSGIVNALKQSNIKCKIEQNRLVVYR